MATIQENIDRIKDAKEDLRGAINAKGGTLAEDARLEEFADAVESLESKSPTAIDFGSAYSDDINTVAGRLSDDLAFTKEVEEGLASGKYNEDDLLAGTQMVDFRGKSYVFRDRIAFYPKGMNEPNDCQNMRRLIQWDRTKPTGNSKFKNCISLQLFASNLSLLKDGTFMFHSCTSLQSFTNDLSALKTGNYMFQQCSSLQSFESDLSALTAGSSMFYQCSSLQSFISDLRALTAGTSMFYQCSSLQHVKLYGWGVCSLSFSSCPQLTPQSIHNIIQAGKSSYKEGDAVRKLTLHSTAMTNWTNSEYHEQDLDAATSSNITIVQS